MHSSDMDGRNTYLERNRSIRKIQRKHWINAIGKREMQAEILFRYNRVLRKEKRAFSIVSSGKHIISSLLTESMTAPVISLGIEVIKAEIWNKQSQDLNRSWLITGDRNRTDKGLLPADFESTASTNSATPAYWNKRRITAMKSKINSGLFPFLFFILSKQCNGFIHINIFRSLPL